MIPRSYPTRLNGATNEMIVGVVSAPVETGRWIDWIPVKINAAPSTFSGTYGATDNIGGIPIFQETVLTGLQAWKDYIPISVVVSDDTNAWNVSSSGFIPVIGTIV